MRTLFCVFALLAITVAGTSAQAAVLLSGEQQSVATPTVAAGQYTLDVFASSDSGAQPVQGWQFQLDFSNPAITFDSGAFGSFAGVLNNINTANADAIGFSSAGFGLPIGNLDGTLAQLASVTFTVASALPLVEIPIFGAIEFRDAGNDIIPSAVVGNLSIAGAPVPSPTGIAGLLSLGLVGLVGYRRRRR